MFSLNRVENRFMDILDRFAQLLPFHYFALHPRTLHRMRAHTHIYIYISFDRILRVVETEMSLNGVDLNRNHVNLAWVHDEYQNKGGHGEQAGPSFKLIELL